MTDADLLAPQTVGGSFGAHPILVVGNGWTASDDIARAKEHLPDVKAIVVNGASSLIPAVAFITYHPRKAEGWVARAKQLNPSCQIHAAGKGNKHYHWIEHWHRDIAKGGGTSAWLARKLACKLGFTHVILCGVPMTPGAYCTTGFKAKNFKPDGCLHYQGQIKADVEWHENVWSMSGWTQEFFGEPPWHTIKLNCALSGTGMDSAYGLTIPQLIP